MKYAFVAGLLLALPVIANTQSDTNAENYKGIALGSIQNLDNLPNKNTLFKPKQLTYGALYTARDESFKQNNVVTPSYLQQKKYSEIITHINELVKKVDKDISAENLLVNEIYAMYVLDESYLPSLDELVKANPI